MAVRQVTVFGGSGFIGRHLVQRLAAAGHRVRVAVRDPEAAAFLKPMGEVGQIAIRRADIGNEPQVKAAIAGSDWVINLVGILYQRGRRTFESVHVNAPRLLARASADAQVARLVHVSALGASETSPSVYARTKAMGEKVVRDNFPTATIVRPSVVFGPEDAFFNRFAALARRLPFLPLFTDDVVNGQGTRFQPVYVGDVAEAIVKALETPATAGRTYELGGPRAYTMREIYELILRTIERRRVILPVPFWVGELQAAGLQYLPNPPLTPDQIRLLKTDNVLTGRLPGFADLGIQPIAPDAIVPTYLDRYRASFRHTILRAV